MAPTAYCAGPAAAPVSEYETTSASCNSPHPAPVTGRHFPRGARTAASQPIAENARRTDAELTAAYAAVQAAVFASLLDLAAAVLKRLPDVRPETMPRMADFACVLQAVDDVKGWDTVASYAATADTIAADRPEAESADRTPRRMPALRGIRQAAYTAGCARAST